MRQNDDGKTVAAMDILAPGIGEIVGGSQREERLDKLEKQNERNAYSRGTNVVVSRYPPLWNCSPCRFWIWVLNVWCNL